ncbi:hypothetical protein [Actinoplanes hulinensis]|nr:hypothetical protein [Actinoplanes hulinensis]
MRALADLIDTEDSAWPEILNAVAGKDLNTVSRHPVPMAEALS